MTQIYAVSHRIVRHLLYTADSKIIIVLFRPVGICPSYKLESMTCFFCRLDKSIQIRRLISAGGIGIISEMNTDKVIIILRNRRFLFCRSDSYHAFLFLLSFIVQCGIIDIIFRITGFSVTSAAETVGNTCQPSLIGNIFIPASLRIQIAVSRIEVDVFIECKIHTGFPDGCIL